jgi:hypothetical protein
MRGNASGNHDAMSASEPTNLLLKEIDIEEMGDKDEEEK